MFNFTIIQTGETKDRNLSSLIDDYIKRIRASARMEVVTFKDLSHGKVKNEAGRNEIKKREAEKILDRLNGEAVIIAMDERGKEFTSLEFAEYLRKKHDGGYNSITFIIGGCFGLDKRVIDKASMTLSLSKFTLTHEQARLVLAEQIYRALSIIAGREYHY